LTTTRWRKTSLKAGRNFNITLTPQQDAFLDEVLKSGEYQDASDAIRDAIRALQQRRIDDELKREKLRVSIRAGIAALERGDYIDVDDKDLEAFSA
jgi:antitoxin ParD1/3/4